MAGWELLQWPAMGTAIVGAWLTGDRQAKRRQFGFMLYLVSNAGWFAMGQMCALPALSLQSIAFTLPALRGVWNNRSSLQE